MKYIYEFKFGDAKDWILATNIKEAKECHLNFTQCGDHSGCEISKVPKKDWDSMYIVDDSYTDVDDQEDEEDYLLGNKIIMTFKQFAEEAPAPDFIATTEF